MIYVRKTVYEKATKTLKELMDNGFTLVINECHFMDVSMFVVFAYCNLIRFNFFLKTCSFTMNVEDIKKTNNIYTYEAYIHNMRTN